MSEINPKLIYVEKQARHNYLTHKLLYKYNQAEIREIDSQKDIVELYKNPDAIKNWMQIKRDTLILANLKGISARPNCRSTDFIAPSHSSGCFSGCLYCYVPRRKGTANPITIFTNFDKILNYLRGHDERNGPKQVTSENYQTDPKYRTYDIGENNDCSFDAKITDSVKKLVHLFRDEMKWGKASFSTKFVNYEMLEYEPNRKTRIRFALMPENISKTVDIRTSSINERIKAIEPFFKAGYEVHINFSPIIIY
ncbi:MAG: spore photoproduct lyase family protein, partial [Thioploca sp.]|nr:spore photoproduct lyase family protein [Thioploca sp.]